MAKATLSFQQSTIIYFQAFFFQGTTIAYYNVDPSSEIQPSNLYLGIETVGSEPLNINFLASDKDELYVPPTDIPTVRTVQLELAIRLK